MTLTTVLAIYGAVVATGAAAWQVYTWWRNERTRVTVRAAEQAYYGASGEQAGWAFLVTVVNRSGHDVSVVEVSVKDADEDRYHEVELVSNGRRLPITIDPHHQLELGCDSSDLEGFNTLTPITVRVRLGDDSLHYSPSTKL